MKRRYKAGRFLCLPGCGDGGDGRRAHDDERQHVHRKFRYAQKGGGSSGDFERHRLFRPGDAVRVCENAGERVQLPENLPVSSVSVFYGCR